MSLYPWQTSQWQTLLQSRQQGRMHHAILLTGPQGLGKEDFARLLARSMLCKAAGQDELPCGTCRACLLYEAGTHPDLKVVTPLEGKKNISVDQVREIGQYLSLTSQYDGYKVVILSPAEAMNVNSANSLLKTLEEPTPNSLLLLVAHRPAQLPATIRSRCQELRFGAVAAEIAKPWLDNALLAEGKQMDSELLLALADGSPLKAMALADDNLIQERITWLGTLEALAKQELDPVAAATKQIKQELDSSLFWLYSWAVDMIRLRSCNAPPRVANSDIEGRLRNLANRISLKGLMKWLELVESAMRDVEKNLNPTLIMEGLLIHWQNMYSRALRN